MTDTTDIPEAAAPAGVPNIYQALAAVMRDVTAVGKNQVNQAQKYKFRGIDDLMSAVAGPLRNHGVFILPTVVDSRVERRGEKMTAVYLTMNYKIYGPDGNCVEATVPGEASDFADKATNKAMSAALKYLLLQVLMIPVDGKFIDDGDRHHPENPPVGAARTRRGRQTEADPWDNPPPARQADPVREAPAGRDDPVLRAAAMSAMREQAEKANFTDGLAAQFQNAYGCPIEQGTTAQFQEAYRMMGGGQ